MERSRLRGCRLPWVTKHAWVVGVSPRAQSADGGGGETALPTQAGIQVFTSGSCTGVSVPCPRVALALDEDSSSGPSVASWLA